MLNLQQFMGLSRFNAEHQQSGSAERIQRWRYRFYNTSIWFMSWGENTAHMIFPKV
jgi:hypothetical protein